VIYDEGVALLDTWRSLESLVDGGKCKAIGLSDVGLDQTKEIFEAGIFKPAVVHVESHPYHHNDVREISEGIKSRVRFITSACKILTDYLAAAFWTQGCWK
jgi:diketogulonate reductase-like aldo/keto reductase